MWGSPLSDEVSIDRRVFRVILDGFEWREREGQGTAPADGDLIVGSVNGRLCAEENAAFRDEIGRDLTEVA